MGNIWPLSVILSLTISPTTLAGVQYLTIWSQNQTYMWFLLTEMTYYWWSIHQLSGHFLAIYCSSVAANWIWTKSLLLFWIDKKAGRVQHWGERKQTLAAWVGLILWAQLSKTSQNKGQILHKINQFVKGMFIGSLTLKYLMLYVLTYNYITLVLIRSTQQRYIKISYHHIIFKL